MKSMTDVLVGIVGLAAVAIAVWLFILFLTAIDPGSRLPDMSYGVKYLWGAVAAFIVACAAVVAYFVRHPRVEEQIHITD
jgi:asparagine N-glycosylation enzyme membrane subunit Stt3